MCENCEWEDALDMIDEALCEVEDLPDNAADFAESVEEKLRNLDEWISDNEHVTASQFAAIENMAAGIRRWNER